MILAPEWPSLPGRDSRRSLEDVSDGPNNSSATVVPRLILGVTLTSIAACGGRRLDRVGLAAAYNLERPHLPPPVGIAVCNGGDDFEWMDSWRIYSKGRATRKANETSVPRVSGRRAPCEQERGSQRADLLERQALRLVTTGRLAATTSTLRAAQRVIKT